MESHNQFNLLVRSAKIMGKGSNSAPQSEIASSVLAVKMERKIALELSNITLSKPMFISDSEIVHKMIARNNPAGLPMFYRTRIMEISALSIADNWNWCPESLNTADLLTRSGATLENINSSFWLQGSFLPLANQTVIIINLRYLSLCHCQESICRSASSSHRTHH